MKIKFIARDPYMYEISPRPFPAAQELPDWWRSMTPYHKSSEDPSGKKLIIENGVSNATFKKCIPMLDALTSGYIAPLWSDVQVRQVNNEARITWKVTPNVFEEVGGSSAHIKPPEGYSNQVFKYANPWIPRTPKGYSTLVVQPFNSIDNPFYCIPAVIDSDTSTLDISPPMWIKKDFEGIIEKGTPMIQLIPFKRENWTSEVEYLGQGKYEEIKDKNFNSTIVGHYLKNYWSKKTYK
jgi:hypothetical protein